MSVYLYDCRFYNKIAESLLMDFGIEIDGALEKAIYRQNHGAQVVV